MFGGTLKPFLMGALAALLLLFVLQFLTAHSLIANVVAAATAVCLLTGLALSTRARLRVIREIRVAAGDETFDRRAQTLGLFITFAPAVLLHVVTGSQLLSAIGLALGVVSALLYYRQRQS
jgi:hypothetical protein